MIMGLFSVRQLHVTDYNVWFLTCDEVQLVPLRQQLCVYSLVALLYAVVLSTIVNVHPVVGRCDQNKELRHCQRAVSATSQVTLLQ